MNPNHSFELPSSYKKWTIGLIVVGVIALLYGLIAFHPFTPSVNGDHIDSTRFWGSVITEQRVLFIDRER
jgi:hypothetical protein